MLRKGPAVAGKERQYTHRVAKFRSRSAYARSQRECPTDTFDNFHTEPTQLDRAAATQWLERYGQVLADHHSGLNPLPRCKYRLIRRAAKACLDGD